MKKIITAAAVAAMAASFAAADAKFSVNYRTGIQFLEHQMKKGTTMLNSYTDNRKTEDALTFKGSSEYGGIELEIDPKVDTGVAQSLSLQKYNGWINFGDFMIKSGTWDSRAVGRVNNDIGNHEGKFWGEINKPGLAVSGLGNDISQQNGKKTKTTMVQYKNNDLGLEARVAFLDKQSGDSFAGNKTTGDKSFRNADWVFANDTWFGEVGYTVDGIGRVMATGKFAHKDYAGALFFEPKLADMEELTSLVGFTFETKTNAAKDNKGDDVAANAMALDLRARYDLGAFVEGLSATVMYNWTFGNNVADGTDKKPGFYATWAMLNLTYALNDTFKPFLSLGWSNASSCGKSDTAAAFDDPFTYSLRTYAGVEIYNTKNANIITGVCWDAANMNDTVAGGKCTKTVSIPVLFRVKF